MSRFVTLRNGGTTDRDKGSVRTRAKNQAEALSVPVAYLYCEDAELARLLLGLHSLHDQAKCEGLRTALPLVLSRRQREVGAPFGICR